MINGFARNADEDKLKKEKGEREVHRSYAEFPPPPITGAKSALTY
jgi:hypothetical protein